MATPTPTIHNLTGDWVIDKSKSQNIDSALKLQGIGWLRRKAVTSGTITLKVVQSQNDTGVSNIMMQQGLRGIFPGVEQSRTLDWSETEQVDAVSGAKVIVRSRFVGGVGVDGEEGKVKPVLEVESDGTDYGVQADVERYLGSPIAIAGGEEDLEKVFVQDFIRCEEGGWTAEQIWAVGNTADGLRLTCKTVAVKGSSTEQACQVYQLAEQ